MDERVETMAVVQTENKGTATSASLYRLQNIADAQETMQVGFGTLLFGSVVILLVMKLSRNVS